MRRLGKTAIQLAAGLMLFGCVPLYDAPYDGYYPYDPGYGYYGYPALDYYGSSVLLNPYDGLFYGAGFGYFGFFDRSYRGRYGRSYAFAHYGHGYGRGFGHGYAGGGGFHGGGGHGGGGGHR